MVSRTSAKERICSRLRNYSGLGLTRHRERAKKIPNVGPLCKFSWAYLISYYTFPVHTRRKFESLLGQYCKNNSVFAGEENKSIAILRGWDRWHFHMPHPNFIIPQDTLAFHIPMWHFNEPYSKGHLACHIMMWHFSSPYPNVTL